MKFKPKNSILLLLILFTILLPYYLTSVRAQTLSSGDSASNPNDTGFKLVVCDGPTLPPSVAKPAGYVPCDFNGVMRTAQHLINIMMVAGVFVAVALISYAGGLMVTGNPENMKKAKVIFPKIFGGFIIMLSAWFIVYQILDWLTTNAGFKTLLGSP